MHDDVWDRVTPFALAHADIRTAVIAQIRSEWGGHSLHHFQKLIIALRGDELRDFLIAKARDEQGWGTFWAVRPLALGWGRDDPLVASFFEEVATWDNAKLCNLASILPKIITDPEECKVRLRQFASQSDARFDLIVPATAEIGYSPDDFVELLISEVGDVAPLFDPRIALVLNFPANARVRALANRLLEGRAPPLAAIAVAFKDDPEIRAAVLAFANPLPVALRGDLADMAPGEAAARQCFRSILENYDSEVDPELKIAASIYHHRAISGQAGGPSARSTREAAHGPSCGRSRLAGTTSGGFRRHAACRPRGRCRPDDGVWRQATQHQIRTQL